jgi:O-antigen/teichoic acid export membrane protein
MVMGRVLIPVTRQNPPGDSAANFARYRRFRLAALAALLAMAAVLAFAGPWLIGVMYDPRYHGAAGIVVMIAAVQAPGLVILTCDQVALARGDSRRFFWLTLARGLLVAAGIYAGLHWGGLWGALIGLGAANLLTYPVLVWLLRPHGAWDPVTDLAAYATGAVIFASALWYNAAPVARLAMMQAG